MSPFSLNTQFPTRRFICFFVSPFLAFLSSTQWQFRMGKHQHLIPRGGKMNSIAPRVHFSRECASLTSNYTENTHKDILGNHSRANQLFFFVIGFSRRLSKKVWCCDVKISKPNQNKIIGLSDILDKFQRKWDGALSRIPCQKSTASLVFFCYNFLKIFRGSVIVWCPWWPNFLCLLSTGHCWSGNLTEQGKRNILQICGFGVSFLWVGLFIDMREYIMVAILKTKVH